MYSLFRYRDIDRARDRDRDRDADRDGPQADNIYIIILHNNTI